MTPDITTRKVFHTESGLPEEVPFINRSVSISMKQVNVMGHNKCSWKCPSASPLTVLEVEETYGDLISRQENIGTMYFATGRNIPQVNLTRDRLEYTYHELKVETHKSMMDTLLTYMAQMTGLTNEVLKHTSP